MVLGKAEQRRGDKHIQGSLRLGTEGDGRRLFAVLSSPLLASPGPGVWL